MGRVIRSVNIPVELNEIIGKYVENFSEYVQECIRRDFNVEYLKKLNEKDMEIIKQRKERIKEIQKDPDQKDKKEIKKEMDEKEKEFFEETREVLKRDVGFLSGRWNLYKNKFGKSMTLNKFKEILDKGKI